MYKFSKYNSIIPLSDNISALYNSKEDKCIVIKRNLEEYFKLTPVDLEKNHPSIYQNLLDINAIVDQNLDELQEVIKRSKEVDYTDKTYRLIINPTMNCNFKCWYCYESHIVGSKMSNEGVNRIMKFIDKTLENNKNLNSFDLSFFGGEPLMYYSKVTEPIINHYRTQYENYPNINFTISFTTNAYLLNDKMVNHLTYENDNKFFQITLDGGREEHNKVRVAQKEEGSYDKIISSIKTLIKEKISVLIRINYTAENIDSTKLIVEDLIDISEEDRQYLSISFHQVWQDIEVNNIDEKVKEVMELYQKHNLIPAGEETELLEGLANPCYADKKNEAVINYNGDVYKCTARDFTKENKYGELNEEGEIEWNEKILTWETLKIQSKACQNCRILPLCGGGCHQINLEAKGLDKCQMGYDNDKKDEVIMNRLEKLFFHEA
ncbi:radical SAM protein [Chryseobacterium sp.]|uniref:radical SAM/SPASM domain-containing protein n=1 Tax=Chryseobacterium sp. TaxID=1871047 RepID=UPI001B18DD46|nr:radical SAM protein [Chryseobacterium sp.]MBO9693655.1 SPASM domain-containing protein [Chryseobacterium sp.]